VEICGAGKPELKTRFVSHFQPRPRYMLLSNCGSVHCRLWKRGFDSPTCSCEHCLYVGAWKFAESLKAQGENGAKSLTQLTTDRPKSKKISILKNAQFLKIALALHSTRRKKAMVGNTIRIGGELRCRDARTQFFIFSDHKVTLQYIISKVWR
jgi:hypothetical protein